MTVGQLKKKLSKFKEDTEVLIDNDCLFIAGTYKATKIETLGDEAIVITSDHKNKVM